MAIGPKIKRVFRKVGTSITLNKGSQIISGEYIDYEENRQVTKPFIREFFIEASFAYDSLVKGGDVAIMDTTGIPFIVMNVTPVQFKNAVIENACVLYKANVSGELWRQSGELWDPVTYESQANFVMINSGCYGLAVERLLIGDIEQNEPIGQIQTNSLFLYIPHRFGAKPLDRYIVSSGEIVDYYKIEEVETKQYQNVDVCLLVEDTRVFP